MDIRVIEALDLEPVASQAIYHAVAESLTPETPDTVILVRPTRPYICVGFHQDVDRELDIPACVHFGLPVIRRQVGGGAVYLDSDQLFIQWVFHASSLPLTLNERYALFADPLVRTYESFGIAAHFRPINDIHVGNRKIGGTGAATIEAAEVLVGSIMNHIDARVMSQVLRVSSEKMRDKLYDNIAEYVTTITRELGHPIDIASLTSTYLASLEAALGRHTSQGCLTEKEQAKLEEVQERLESDEWLHAGGGRRPIGTKIHEGRYLYEGSHKAAGGLVRWIFVVEGDTIADCTLEGDFTVEPADVPRAMADALIGVPTAHLSSAIRALCESFVTEAPGVTTEDFIEAAMNGLSGDARGSL